MIDYLKLESELEPFSNKEWKEYADLKEKCLVTFFLVLMLMSLIVIAWMVGFDESKTQSEGIVKSILYFILSGLVITPIFLFPRWKFRNKKIHIEYDNFETEENLKKVSYFGIENVNNFKNNIQILKEKTEYMIFKNYQEKEKYINKLLNIFYIEKKGEQKNEESEILKLLKK